MWNTNISLILHERNNCKKYELLIVIPFCSVTNSESGTIPGCLAKLERLNDGA